MCVAAEIFLMYRKYSRPKDPLSLSILSCIVALANHEEFSEKGKNPKKQDHYTK